MHRIPGIQFIYLGTETVTPSTVTQTIYLEKFGIKIYLPPNAFSEPVFDITVGAALSGRFISPESMTLVSAVYYIRMSSELLRPVTVEIEHCVILSDEDKTSGLKFGKADMNSYWASPPYTFKTLSEGIFPVGNHGGLYRCLVLVYWVFSTGVITIHLLNTLLVCSVVHALGRLAAIRCYFLLVVILVSTMRYDL